MPSEQIDHRRSETLVRDVDQMNARSKLELLHGKLRSATGPR